MLTCHTPPLLFLVLYLSPLLSLFIPPLLLNLLLLRCEVILTDAVATSHKSSFGILALFLLQSVYLLFASPPETGIGKKYSCCY